MRPNRRSQVRINAEWIDDNKESSLNFDIAVEVDAEVEGVYGKHHDHDCFNSHFWLLINCKGDLKNNIIQCRTKNNQTDLEISKIVEKMLMHI